jgi:TusA-related sulfurtransferase
MKKLALVLAVMALVAASPVLACGEGKGKMAGCPFGMKGVEKSATNLDNGVTITMKSSDPEKVKALQAAIAAEDKEEGGCNCPMHAKNTKRVVENTADGVVLTVTTDDKDQVKTLQTFAAKNCKGGCPMHKGEKA